MQAGRTQSVETEPRAPTLRAVRERFGESATERRRFGYRDLGWLLAREGHVIDSKKLYRIHREEKVMVRRLSQCAQDLLLAVASFGIPLPSSGCRRRPRLEPLSQITAGILFPVLGHT